MTDYKKLYYEMGPRERLEEFLVFDELYKEKMSYTELVDFIVKNPEVIRVCRDMPFAADARIIFEATLRNPTVKFYSSCFIQSPVMQKMVLDYEDKIREDGNEFLDKYTKEYLRMEAIRNYCNEKDWEKYYTKKLRNDLHKSWEYEYIGNDRAKMVLITDKNELTAISPVDKKSRINEMEAIKNNLIGLGYEDTNWIFTDPDNMRDDFYEIAEEVEMDEFHKIMPKIADFFFGEYLSDNTIDRFAGFNKVRVEEKIK